MKLGPLFTAVALASGMVSAMADTFDIGTLPLAPAVYSNVHNVQSVAPGGSFTDLYSFLFPLDANAGSTSAVTINLGSILNIDYIQVSLLDAGQSIIYGGSVGGPGSVLYDWPMTPGNSYFFRVTGFATGSAGGTYSFLASAAPIPEPGSYALMLAGLAVVGSIVRRRRPT